MYVCTYVFMYLCMYLCMHLCMYVGPYLCMHSMYGTETQSRIDSIGVSIKNLIEPHEIIVGGRLSGRREGSQIVRGVGLGLHSA